MSLSISSVVLLICLCWYSGNAIKCYVCGGNYGTVCPKVINETETDANCTSCSRIGFKNFNSAEDEEVTYARSCTEAEAERINCSHYTGAHATCKLCAEDLCNGPEPQTQDSYKLFPQIVMPAVLLHFLIFLVW